MCSEIAGRKIQEGSKPEFIARRMLVGVLSSLMSSKPCTSRRLCRKARGLGVLLKRDLTKWLPLYTTSKEQTSRDSQKLR
jgi:hypothetical protein